METRGQSRATAHRGERGVTLVLTTLGILGVVFAAGLCIDFSRLYMAQTELQDAADAAAIAGASELNSTSGGINLAVTEATKTLNKYDVNTSVTIPSSGVTFSVNLNGTYMNQASAAAAPASIRFIKYSDSTESRAGQPSFIAAWNKPVDIGISDCGNVGVADDEQVLHCINLH